MKNTIKFLGVIAIIAVIGFSFTACGGDNDGGGNTDDVWSILKDTTWIKEGESDYPKIVFNNSSNSPGWASSAYFGGVLGNEDITFSGGTIKSQTTDTFICNFELKENNTKLVISNFADGYATLGGRSSFPEMNGTYTQR